MNHTYRIDCTKKPFKEEMTEEIVDYHRILIVGLRSLTLIPLRAFAGLSSYLLLV